MNRSPRTLPVVLSGGCAFLTLYATQPILPLLAAQFHAGKVAVSLTITFTTLGVALSAPFIGEIADRTGRKRVIVWSAMMLAVATLLTATSPNLPWLLFWRFVQGLVTPGVFAVTTAWVHEQWPAERAPAIISAYVSGTVLGGFIGRFVAGITAGNLGWRWAFIVLGLLSLAMAVYLAAALPGESKQALVRRNAGEAHPLWLHLRNKCLLSAYSIGFCVLFSMVATFTYVSFYLAASPFLLGPGALGLIFVVYLAGAVITPLAGTRIVQYGHRNMLLAAGFMSAAGACATLVPRLWIVFFGLALCCSGTFLAQASTTSHIGAEAESGRALAMGLYVTFYYAGGSVGAAAPGWAWQAWGWPGCVALIVLIQVVIASIALASWRSTDVGEVRSVFEC